MGWGRRVLYESRARAHPGNQVPITTVAGSTPSAAPVHGAHVVRHVLLDTYLHLTYLLSMVLSLNPEASERPLVEGSIQVQVHMNGSVEACPAPDSDRGP